MLPSGRKGTVGPKGVREEMSQEKVDRYKKEKANRKQIMRRQRLMSFVRKGVLTLAAAALVGWLAYSAYGIHEANRERVVAEVNYDAVTDYLNSLTSDAE